MLFFTCMCFACTMERKPEEGVGSPMLEFKMGAENWSPVLWSFYLLTSPMASYTSLQLSFSTGTTGISTLGLLSHHTAPGKCLRWDRRQLNLSCTHASCSYGNIMDCGRKDSVFLLSFRRV